MSDGGSPRSRKMVAESQPFFRAHETTSSPSRATRPLRIRPLHQATVEDVPEDMEPLEEPDYPPLSEGAPEAKNIQGFAEGPGPRPTTAPAGSSASPVGSPFIEHTTIASDESSVPTQLDGQPPQPQRRFSTGAAAARPGPYLHHSPPAYPPPEVFRYLDPDSPIVTPEAIRGFSFESQGLMGLFPTSIPSSPPVLSSPSSTPSNSSSLRSDIFPNGRPSGPASSVASRNQGPRGGFGRPTPLQQYAVPYVPTDSTMSNGQTGFHHGWPSPGTPYRGPVSPRSPSQFGHPIQPPVSPGFHYARPAHQMPPPMTGYEFLTAKLGGSLFGEPRLTPIYRRFDAIGHRVLLELQLELCGLEEELHSIDELDTQGRLLPDDTIKPASALAAAHDQTPTAQRRREILDTIATQLEIYHQRLKSFMDVRDMPRPSHNEVEAYRQFLSNGSIVEQETQFISATEDHVSLSFREPDFIQLHAGGRGTCGESQMSTPTPEATSRRASPFSVRSEEGTTAFHQTDGRKGARPPPGPGAKPHLPWYMGLGLLFAFLSPLIGVCLIPSFGGRLFMIIVALGWVVSVVWQSGISTDSGIGARPHELVLYAGAYVGAMAATAWAF